MSHCKAIGCFEPVNTHDDFCQECSQAMAVLTKPTELIEHTEPESLAEKYPAYYKQVGNLTEIDVYAVHHLFNIQDPSGCVQHASKKLLLSGVRTGSKSKYKDLKEARDTLSRWLQLNEDIQ